LVVFFFKGTFTSFFKDKVQKSKTVLWIRHMFFGLLDPDPDPLVRGLDLDPVADPDPSIIMEK
jgi:hypothetical protein